MVTQMIEVVEHAVYCRDRMGDHFEHRRGQVDHVATKPFDQTHVRLAGDEYGGSEEGQQQERKTLDHDPNGHG